MKKEKINWGKVFLISIPVSIVATIVILMIFELIIGYISIIIPDSSDNSKSINSSMTLEEKAKANNSQYEDFMGDNVSYETVKQLLNIIYKNNITAENNEEEMKKIGIVDATEYKENLEVISPEKMSIKDGEKYSVQVYDEKTSIKDPLTEDKYDKSGYYKNGFIRIIKIELDKKGETSE